MSAIIREVTIGNCRLIQGDCLAVMPLLGKVDAVVACCDAVVYTDIHGKTANWKPETSSESGVNMGKPQSGDSVSLRQRNNVTGSTGGSLRGQSAGYCEGFEAHGHPAEVEGQGGRTERSIHRRNAKHDLPANGGENALQQMRGNGSVACASCGRGSHEQRGREFGSVVQPLSQQPPQTGMVELPEGWAILTDPPYGIAYKASQPDAVEYGIIDNDDGSLDLRPILTLDVPVLSFGANNYPEQLPHKGRWLCWDKRTIDGAADAMLGQAFELAWSNKTSGYGKIVRILHGGTVNADGHGQPRFHPTQKPIALMRAAILWAAGEAQTILDPFAGSGTTGVACVNLGRKFIGIEKDPDYFEIMCRRIDDAHRQADLFVAKPAHVTPTQEGFDI